jgi:protease-4
VFINLHYKLNRCPWYIKPDFFASLKAAADELPQKMRQQEADDFEEFLSFFINQRPPVSIDSNGIAVIAISGVLGTNLAPIEKLLGFCDYQDIQNEIEEITEQAAKAVLFDVDSPGGTVQGAPETAAAIAALNIPKASYTAGLDCSAAYYLSSSCDRKFVSPSAITGSIGTMLPWIDQSKLWDAFGIAWEPITGQGETLKDAGAGPSLTDAQRDFFQGQVNDLSAAFQNHVSQFREIDYSQLKGGAHFGTKAIDLNLVDNQGSYDDAYQWLYRLVS